MKRQPTPEQKEKAEARRAHLRELAERVAAMTDEEKAALLDKVGTVLTCEGHPLSPKNSLLLAYQAEHVSMVGGYNQWINAGRQVRKGETSLGIWIPKEQKPDANRPEGMISEQDLRPFFIFGSVFDITQTDPIQATAA